MHKLISSRFINIVLSVLGLVIILLFILTGKNQLIYDEFNFVPNIFLLEKVGLTKTFLLNIQGSAGPTYPVYYHLFYKSKTFNIMSLRLANYFLLIILLLFIFLNSRLLGYKDSLILSLNFIVIPLTWVFCGLALTEIPAMTCAMIGFYFFLKGFLPDIKFQYKIFFVFTAGVFFSFAILGRSFYLMAIIAIIFWLLLFLLQDRRISKIRNERFWYFSTKKQAFFLIAIFILSSVILPFKVFFIWGALTPPNGTEAVGANDIKIVPWYGILAYAYSGFITLILAPSWFIVKRKIIYFFLALTLLFMIGNIMFNIYEFSPLNTTMAKILPANLFICYVKIMPGLLLSISLYFIFSTFSRLWENKENGIYILIGVIALFIVFATVKVTTQFSPRYVGQVLPFFILLFAPFEKTNWNKIVRICIGLIIGFLSLYSYYSGKF